MISSLPPSQQLLCLALRNSGLPQWSWQILCNVSNSLCYSYQAMQSTGTDCVFRINNTADVLQYIEIVVS